MILPSNAENWSWLIIWETRRGVLTIKEDNGKTWKGKAPGKRYHANRRGSRSLQTNREDLERETSLGKREDAPGNVRHLNLGKPSS